MPFRKKFLSLFLLISVLNPSITKPYLGECLKNTICKTVKSVTQSRPFYWLNRHAYLFKYIAKKTSKTNNFELYENASREYITLGEEAQTAVGIPKKYQLPIKKFECKTEKHQDVYAFVHPDAIYINEDKLKNLPYGCKRCILFHEAIHAKYNDVFCAKALLIPMFVPQIRCRYWNHREHRADAEGCLATQCSKCVLERAKLIGSYSQIPQFLLEQHGYLSAEETKKIAESLSQQSKLCVYHKNHRSNF